MMYLHRSAAVAVAANNTGATAVKGTGQQSSFGQSRPLSVRRDIPDLVYVASSYYST